MPFLITPCSFVARDFPSLFYILQILQKLTVCEHVECNAHIDRYLRSGIDFNHHEECKELHEMLHRKREVMEECKRQMPENEIKSFEDDYVEILEGGLKNYNDKNPVIEKKYEAGFVKTFRRMFSQKII